MQKPLAERMRPKTIDQIIGQDHLLGNGKALRQIIEKGKLHSMIFLGSAWCWQNNVGKSAGKPRQFTN
jgi:replication-associated recombination protein RarA